MSSLRSLLVAVPVLLTALATGCAAAPGEEEPTAEAEAALGQTIDVPNPSGVYLASLSANGTGCPAGSWEAAISEDGKAFTVTFSSYEAIVEPGKAFSIKDCTLGLDLKTPQGVSFAITSFYYQGYALLDRDGMTAKQTAKYWFMGNPAAGTENARELSGPYDDSYLFMDEVPVPSLVWSPCGTQRRLNALTRLVLRNNASKTGSGYLNTSSVDGDLQMVFHLSWRKC
jgi:hypothetical protein